VRSTISVCGFLASDIAVAHTECTAEFAENHLSQIISPYTLHGACTLLTTLVEPARARAYFKSEHPELAPAVLNAYLKVRSFMLQRSRLMDKCAASLLQVVKSVFSDSQDDRRSTIRAYVHALEHTVGDQRTAIFILEQLCALIRPRCCSRRACSAQGDHGGLSVQRRAARRKPEREVLLVLKKASSQEEYIRGDMKKNPYSSRDLAGPLMRDIKNKICADLQLQDATNMFELLVNNKIINLDLPVTKVYEQGARRRRGCGRGQALRALIIAHVCLSSVAGRAVQPGGRGRESHGGRPLRLAGRRR
jgi:hypothetical protein